MLIKDNPSRDMSVKDVDLPSRTVQAYVSSWDDDAIGDRFLPGAWKKSIKERGPKAKNRIWVLKDHDITQQVAKPTEITEDGSGLLFTFRIPETTLGNDVLTLYREGYITEHSVGFDLVKGKYAENELGGFDYKEAVLWEGSSVAWGMNEHTPTLSVRSLTTESVAAHVSKIERTKRLLENGHFDTDEVPEQLVRYLNDVSVFLKELSITFPVREETESRTESTPNEPDGESAQDINALYDALKACVS